MKCFLALVLLYFNFGFQNPKSIIPNNQYIIIDTSRYTLIKFNKERHQIYFDSIVQPASLSINELANIEDLINKKAAQYNAEQKEMAKQLVERHKKKHLEYQLRDYFNLIAPTSNYYKQIIAVVNQAGEKEVWVNCFCSKPGDAKWKRTVVEVLDGGSCYFHLKTNLTKNTVANFMVNGVA